MALSTKNEEKRSLNSKDKQSNMTPSLYNYCPIGKNSRQDRGMVSCSFAINLQSFVIVYSCIILHYDA